MKMERFNSKKVPRKNNFKGVFELTFKEQITPFTKTTPQRKITYSSVWVMKLASSTPNHNNKSIDYCHFSVDIIIIYLTLNILQLFLESHSLAK